MTGDGFNWDNLEKELQFDATVRQKFDKAFLAVKAMGEATEPNANATITIQAIYEYCQRTIREIETNQA